MVHQVESQLQPYQMSVVVGVGVLVNPDIPLQVVALLGKDMLGVLATQRMQEVVAEVPVLRELPGVDL